MEKKDNEKQTALKKVKSENKTSETVRHFSKRILINRTNTFILIAILIAIFLLINSIMRKIDLTPIDCTKGKEYTLTEESKNRVKDIEKKVKIYMANYTEGEGYVTLVKQYNKTNSNIEVEIVNTTENIGLAQKYNLPDKKETIVIECGELSKVLSYSDFMSSDSEDIAEQKITSTILKVVADKTPCVYFLDGFSAFSIDGANGNLQCLAQYYLENEVLTYKSLNILNTQKVPDDCDTLVIMTPDKDFDKVTTDAILKYIKNGGNILWLNGAYAQNLNLTNVNKILAEYGINPFDIGYVYETNSENIAFKLPFCMFSKINSTDFTKDLVDGLGALFMYPTKINIDSDKLESLNVEKTDLILSEDSSYFSKEVFEEATKKNSEQGGFVLGAQMTKTVSEKSDEEDSKEVKSEMIIFGNDLFVTDQGVESQQGIIPFIMLSQVQNADIVLNSIAHLTETKEDITIRKNVYNSDLSFTISDAQKVKVLTAIIMIPIVVIVAGIIVWLVRRYRV